MCDDGRLDERQRAGGVVSSEGDMILGSEPESEGETQVQHPALTHSPHVFQDGVPERFALNFQVGLLSKLY